MVPWIVEVYTTSRVSPRSSLLLVGPTELLLVVLGVGASILSIGVSVLDIGVTVVNIAGVIGGTLLVVGVVVRALLVVIGIVVHALLDDIGVVVRALLVIAGIVVTSVVVACIVVTSIVVPGVVVTSVVITSVVITSVVVTSVVVTGVAVASVVVPAVVVVPTVVIPDVVVPAVVIPVVVVPAVVVSTVIISTVIVSTVVISTVVISTVVIPAVVVSTIIVSTVVVSTVVVSTVVVPTVVVTTVVVTAVIITAVIITAVIITAVVVAIVQLERVITLANGKVDTVIQGPMLSVGDDDGLMVSSSIDCAETMEARFDTLVDSHGHDSVVISSTVNTLEEFKVQGVKGFSDINRRYELYHNVSVSNDNFLPIELLGSSVVVALGIDEVTELHVFDLQLDGESLVGLEGRVGVLGENKLGRRGQIKADDTAHRGRIARSFDFLLTIGKGGVLGQAEIDEIVGGSEGADLAGVGVVALTVLGQTWGDDCRVERERGLGIFLTSIPGRAWDSETGRSERNEGKKGLGGVHHCVCA
jgi:hypothetical protein